MRPTATRLIGRQRRRRCYDRTGVTPIVVPRSEQGTTLSVPLGVRSFEEGELEGDGTAEEVATEVRVCRADPVQLRA